MFIRKIIRRCCSSIESIFSKKWLNPFLTLYVCLRQLPLRQALQFPIFVYGRPRLYCLSGKIDLSGCEKIKRGMVKLNTNHYWAPYFQVANSEFINAGVIKIDGSVDIGSGTKIMVTKNSELHLGKNVRIADKVIITCMKEVRIGESTRLAHNVQIMDSNFHYVANLKTREISRKTHPVIIGKGCWICNSSTVSSGGILPDFTIVASNSLVKKDFSGLECNSLIGGIPAKFITTGLRRVLNSDYEAEIEKYFENEQESFSFPETWTLELISNSTSPV